MRGLEFRAAACRVPQADSVCFPAAGCKVQERNKGTVSLPCQSQGICLAPGVPLGMKTGEGRKGMGCTEPLSPSLVPWDWVAKVGVSPVNQDRVGAVFSGQRLGLELFSWHSPPALWFLKELSRIMN